MSKNKMIMLPREVVEQTLDTLNTVEWSVVESCWIVDGERIDSAINTLRAVLEQPDAGNPATAPEGWKLVPVEPTMSMQHAALIESRSHGPVSTGECNALPITYELGASAIVYRAMLDAAPQPPVLDQTQAEQEPYLYYDPENGGTWTQEAIDDGLLPPDGLIALYTNQKQAPLTVEQIDGIISDLDPAWLDTPTGFEEEFCRAIERAHGIGGKE